MTRVKLLKRCLDSQWASVLLRHSQGGHAQERLRITALVYAAFI